MKRVELVDVPLEKNVVREVTLDGRRMHGSLSAFDFPRALRVALSADGGRAEVDFLYATAPEDASERKSGPQGAVLYVGKNSGRIHRIEFPLPAGMLGGRLTLEFLTREPLSELKEQASRLPWQKRPVRRVAHYEMVPSLLSLVEDKLAKLRSEQGAGPLRR